ncbi:MAG: sigma-70 family RNA polymerase sigma factor [Alistipes sp.]|nr:sigma-70 family RNA polymerase sigma factor [Candidatus Minthomonas equi]
MGVKGKYLNMDEAALVREAVSGDDAAFAVLVERSELMLKGYLSKYSLGEELEDVLQESYRKAYFALSSYQPDISSFSTWIHTIASRTALDYLRSRSVRDVSPLSTNDSGELLQPQVMVNSPEDTLIYNQSYLEAVDRIHSLPSIYRDVAELRFLDELPYEEIASKLSLPLNTVRTRIRRAKDMILEKTVGTGII